MKRLFYCLALAGLISLVACSSDDDDNGGGNGGGQGATVKLISQIKVYRDNVQDMVYSFSYDDLGRVTKMSTSGIALNAQVDFEYGNASATVKLAFESSGSSKHTASMDIALNENGYAETITETLSDDPNLNCTWTVDYDSEGFPSQIVKTYLAVEFKQYYMLSVNNGNISAIDWFLTNLDSDVISTGSLNNQYDRSLSYDAFPNLNVLTNYTPTSGYSGLFYLNAVGLLGLQDGHLLSKSVETLESDMVLTQTYDYDLNEDGSVNEANIDINGTKVSFIIQYQ